MSSWQNIGDIFTSEGKAKLRVGHVLTFDYEGSKTYLKIMSLPANGNVWVRELHLITGEEMEAHWSHAVDTTNETINEMGGPYCTDCHVVIGAAIQPGELDLGSL